MRYRSNSYLLPEMGGKVYFWLVTWHLASEEVVEAVSMPSFIYDDVGRKRVNPLYSLQQRGSRTTHSVTMNDGYDRYVGEVAVKGSYVKPSWLSANSFQDLNAWATIGASKARTIKPVINLNVAAGELLELRQMAVSLRQIDSAFISAADTKKSKIERWNSLLEGGSSATLGHLFGVLPLARLLEDVVNLDRNLNRSLRHVMRKNNKWQKFNYELLNETSSTSVVHNDCIGPRDGLVTSVVINTGTVQEVTVDRIWYEGSIRLRLPKKPTLNGLTVTQREFLTGKLTGRELNGEVLYELAPFSWMLDWYTSLGAFVANAMDHTLYQWKFPCVMHETVTKRTVKGLLEYKVPGGTEIVKPESSCTRTIKRRKAHVFDSIGLAVGGLDPFRAAVLASLAGLGASSSFY